MIKARLDGHLQGEGPDRDQRAPPGALCAARDARALGRNPKKHDLEKLRESITRYGFKDPPKFEPSLNGGKGGIVEGKGRSTVLLQLRKSGAEPPRGVAVDESGKWAVPVLFGVDAASQAEAESYGLDHNSPTLGGSGLPLADVIRIYDEHTLVELLEDRGDLGEHLVSFSSGAPTRRGAVHPGAKRRPTHSTVLAHLVRQLPHLCIRDHAPGSPFAPR